MLLILHGMPIPSGPLKPLSLAVELPVGSPGRRTIRNGPKASAPIHHGFSTAPRSARPTWKGLRLTTVCATRPTRLRLWPGYTGPLVEPA